MNISACCRRFLADQWRSRRAWASSDAERSEDTVDAGPRLALAGLISLALLGWLVTARLGPEILWLLGCLIGAGLVLVTLLPIWMFGLRQDRWLAALLAIFPLLLVNLLWLAPGWF